MSELDDRTDDTLNTTETTLHTNDTRIYISFNPSDDAQEYVVAGKAADIEPARLEHYIHRTIGLLLQQLNS